MYCGVHRIHVKTYIYIYILTYFSPTAREKSMAQRVSVESEQLSEQEENISPADNQTTSKSSRFRPKSHSTSNSGETRALKHQGMLLESIREEVDVEKNDSGEWEESSDDETTQKWRRKTVGRTSKKINLGEETDHKRRLTKLSEIFKRESARISQRLSTFKSKERFSMVGKEQRKSVEIQNVNLEAFLPRKRGVSDATEVEKDNTKKKNQVYDFR